MYFVVDYKEESGELREVVGLWKVFNDISCSSKWLREHEVLSLSYKCKVRGVNGRAISVVPTMDIIKYYNALLHLSAGVLFSVSKKNTYNSKLEGTDYVCNGFSVSSEVHISELILPYGITHIAEGAFKGLSFDRVVLPDTVSVIESRAFWHTKIGSIRFPKEFKTVGASAFEGSELGEIENKNRIFVENIDSNAFAWRYSKGISLGTILDKVSACTYHKDAIAVEIEEPQKRVCFHRVPSSSGSVFFLDDCFRGLRCEVLDFSDIDSRIIFSRRAFRYGIFSELRFPTSIVVIQFSAASFAECYHLKNVKLPLGVSEIPFECFTRCPNLVSVTVEADTLAVVDDSCFTNCFSLEYIDLYGRAVTSEEKEALRKVSSYSLNALSFDFSAIRGCANLRCIRFSPRLNKIEFGGSDLFLYNIITDTDDLRFEVVKGSSAEITLREFFGSRESEEVQSLVDRIVYFEEVN